MAAETGIPFPCEWAATVGAVAGAEMPAPGIALCAAKGIPIGNIPPGPACIPSIAARWAGLDMGVICIWCEVGCWPGCAGARLCAGTGIVPCGCAPAAYAEPVPVGSGVIVGSAARVAPGVAEPGQRSGMVACAANEAFRGGHSGIESSGSTEVVALGN